MPPDHPERALTLEHVAYVNAEYFGGSTTHIFELARHLAERNKVRLWMPGQKDVHRHFAGDFETKFVGRLAGRGTTWRRLIRTLANEVELTVALLVACFRRKPTAIYVREQFSLAPTIVARLLAIPLFLEVNGPLLLEVAQKFPSLLARLAALALKLQARSAAAIFPVTSAQVSYMVRHYGVDGQRVRFIPNGVNLDLFQPSSRDVAVTKLGLDPICQYVVWAGTLRQNQDVALLLQALKSLREKRPELRLLLISRDSEAIASMIEEYGVGGLAQTLTAPYERVPIFLAAATVCAAPISDVPWTREFGISPLKVLEYLASGRPAVAASFPDLQFIAEYGLGFLYEPGHALSLAEALDRALDLSISEQEALGRRARAYVLEHHDWRMTAGLVEGAIRQATERRRTNDWHPGST